MSSKPCAGSVKGRVIAVFGCGGDRDPFKRPIMGRIGAELADLSVVTSDNPRTEDPMAIIDAIVAGMQEGPHPHVVIENRVEAIGWALAHAEKDDVIVLCGKGHETYQEIGHEKRHLDERGGRGLVFGEKRMKELTLQQLASWCGGKVAPEYEAIKVCGIQSDSRKVQPESYS